MHLKLVIVLDGECGALVVIRQQCARQGGLWCVEAEQPALEDE